MHGEITYSVSTVLLILYLSRYIQASYIKMRSEEAKRQAEMDVKKQILKAFFATEELRVQVEKKEQEMQFQSCFSLARKSLQVLETKLAPLLQVVKSSNNKVRMVAESLEHVKHNLVVQVTTLAHLMTLLFVGGAYISANVHYLSVGNIYMTPYASQWILTFLDGSYFIDGSWSFFYSNEDILRIAGATDLSTIVKRQQRGFLSQIVQKSNGSVIKRLIFNSDRYHK